MKIDFEILFLKYFKFKVTIILAVSQYVRQWGAFLGVMTRY